jgi:hypothetical protein
VARHHLWNAIGLIGVVLAVAATAGAQPRCYGAGARDPARPCHAKFTDVTPSPEDALLQPSAPCTPSPSPPLDVCAFGAPAGKETVVLLGDSHSVHWRAALDPVARARG